MVTPCNDSSCALMKQDIVLPPSQSGHQIAVITLPSFVKITCCLYEMNGLVRVSPLEEMEDEPCERTLVPYHFIPQTPTYLPVVLVS
jgi:hypothetical protein